MCVRTVDTAGLLAALKRVLRLVLAAVLEVVPVVAWVAVLAAVVGDTAPTSVKIVDIPGLDLKFTKPRP